MPKVKVDSRFRGNDGLVTWQLRRHCHAQAGNHVDKSDVLRAGRFARAAQRARRHGIGEFVNTGAMLQRLGTTVRRKADVMGGAPHRAGKQAQTAAGAGLEATGFYCRRQNVETSKIASAMKNAVIPA